jgi:isopenicillin-N epimerase
MYGSMVTIPLPPTQDATPAAVQRLKDELLYEDRIETQMHPFAGRAWLRLAAQVYNEAADFERLWQAIERRSGRA